MMILKFAHHHACMLRIYPRPQLACENARRSLTPGGVKLGSTDGIVMPGILQTFWPHQAATDAYSPEDIILMCMRIC